MNIAPSNLPRLAGAASLSKPGFDIVLAVAGVRQSALPTIGLLRARATRDAHRAMVNATCRLLAGSAIAKAPRPVRFFDLSDDANVSTEIMNNLFTRGFQPMLNPSQLDMTASVNPIPPDVETME